MVRTPVIAVIAALVVALVALAVVGMRVLARDRDAMYATFAREQRVGIEHAAQGLAADVANIGEDLDLAATLLADAESPAVRERQLHAIATIKREYMMLDADVGGHVARVVAFDAPDRLAADNDAMMRDMMAAADATPNEVRVSGPLGHHVWYRIFARRDSAAGATVGVAVDMAMLLAHLRVQTDPSAVVIVTNATGMIAPADPHRIDAAAARDIVAGIPVDRAEPTTIDADTALALGLPDALAFAVAVPMHVDERADWHLVLVTSTNVLADQEATLVRRILVGGGLILLLLLSAAAYVLHNARRGAALREAEHIVEHIPSGVLTMSNDLHITSANPWCRDRFRRDLTGATLDVAFANADDIAIVRRLVRDALATGRPQTVPRTRMHGFGDDSFFSVRVIPLERGTADIRLLVVFDDLTPLRRIEEQLLHSEKLVTAGQLAAGIAHEIGTPLNVARGRVELALSHLGDGHPDAGNHKLAIDQIDRVTRLIQQLLEYVRPAPAAMQLVDVEGTLKSVAELLSAQAGKRGVALEVASASGLTALRGDPDHVQQVVINLVLNAVDACSRGGHVGLRARAGDHAVVIEVTDDGAGIPHELQAQVFDPFFTTKKRGQGTGLGLWVVAQLVRAHAAEIELESAPGQGTTVRVSWPVAA